MPLTEYMGIRRPATGWLAFSLVLFACPPAFSETTDLGDSHELPTSPTKVDLNVTPNTVGGTKYGAAEVSQTGSQQNVKRPKIGLALGGGGTRGTAHIGVLRVLRDQGIPVDMVAGTSMGAIVGGLYCAGVSIEEIEKVIYNKKLMRSYLTVPIPVRVAVVPVFFLPHLFGYHPYDGLYRGGKFANFMRKAVGSDYHEIQDMKIPFCAVAANLLDGKAYGITRGDFASAVQASSALPFLRRPVELQDKLLVDGGLVENLPVDRVRQMGADIVIAVDVDDDLKTLTAKDFRKIGSSIARAINMHLSAIDHPQQKQADVVIHPDVTGISLLSLDTRDVDRAVKNAAESTLKAIPVIKSLIKEKSIAVEAQSDAS